MKLFTILFFGIAFLMLSSGSAVYAKSQSENRFYQSEIRYLRLGLPKLEAKALDLLLSELRSYEGKVNEVLFDYEQRELLVMYYDSLSMIDILQIVSKYTSDFTKISGTEMQ